MKPPSSSVGAASVPHIKFVTDVECPNCHSKNTTNNHKSGDAVCIDCGCVVEARSIDTDREWREFESDQNSAAKSRVGGPIDPLNGELVAGISKITDKKYKGITRAQIRESKVDEKKLQKEAFNQVENLANRLELSSNYMRTDKEIIKDWDEKGELTTRNMKLVVATSLFIACKVENNPKSFKEMALMTLVDQRELSQMYSNITKRSPQLSRKLATEKSVTMEARVEKYMKQLNIQTNSTNFFIVGLCGQLATKCMEFEGVEGRSPVTIATSAVYIVLQKTQTLKRSYKDIADISGIAEQTIRGCVRIIQNNPGPLLSEQDLQRLAAL